MPRYDVALAAVALDVPYRWLDQVLARHDVPGVTRETHGVRRTLDHEALVTLAVVRDLHWELGLPVPRAIAVATGAAPDGVFGVVRLAIDRAAIGARLAPLVADAVERVVPRRRGRPPGAGRRGPS